jgi:hypothetical protein
LQRIGEAISALEELAGAAYVEKILRDFGVIDGVRGLTDLPNDRLLNLSITLEARVNAKATENGCGGSTTGSMPTDYEKAK